MSQQAQDDYYGARDKLGMAYAEAVRGEITDLLMAGADIVQVDEPYMQARPDKAREYGLTALNRALQGISGQTAVHICFGYAAIIHERPSGYSFLPELAGSPARRSAPTWTTSGATCRNTSRPRSPPGRRASSGWRTTCCASP
jgi:5-methyltetrahydropteroyltriglutamate--homocysteine methyltransferase